MGSQVFANVDVPLLWGSRAILEDKKGRVTVIDLSGDVAKIEILGDLPAPGVEFRPLSGDLVEILNVGKPLYSYAPATKTLRSVTLNLPECQLSESGTRVGTNRFSNNAIVGFGVGLAVSENGIAMGAPMPPGLAKLRF